MRYLRVYADGHGESHFEDVDVPMRTTRSPVSDARVAVSDWLRAEAMMFRHVLSDHPPMFPTSPRGGNSSSISPATPSFGFLTGTAAGLAPAM